MYVYCLFVSVSVAGAVCNSARGMNSKVHASDIRHRALAQGVTSSQPSSPKAPGPRTQAPGPRTRVVL